MDDKMLSIYSAQVVFQCEAVLLAETRLRAALSTHNRNPIGDERPGWQTSVEIWSSIQDLLGAAANISKMFWGQRGTLNAEREALRRAWHIDGRSPLKEVGMRNNFEHFDERLDRWRTQSKTKNYVDFAIGEMVRVKGGDPLDIFRQLNSRTMEITFWGQSFDLNTIIEEVHRLLTAQRRRLREA